MNVIDVAIRKIKTPNSVTGIVSANRTVGANCIRQHESNVQCSGMAKFAAGGLAPIVGGSGNRKRCDHYMFNSTYVR